MTEVGSVYGQALYDLAKGENLSETILAQLEVLQQSFREAPDFMTLLASPSLTKEERCTILENSFRGKLQDYLLNFLKLLTEKGYIRHFFDCCKAYEESFNSDNGILQVSAVTAVAMTENQKEKLREKLAKTTGKQIKLKCSVDSKVLGGIRLDYSGKRLDDTVQHRLSAIRELLNNTVL